MIMDIIPNTFQSVIRKRTETAIPTLKLCIENIYNETKKKNNAEMKETEKTASG